MLKLRYNVPNYVDIIFAFSEGFDIITLTIDCLTLAEKFARHGTKTV